MSSVTTTSVVEDAPMVGAAGVINGKLVLSQGISRTLGSSELGGKFETIPVIDLSPLTSPNATKEQQDRLVEELRDACLRAGFFVIKNHGIDWQIVENSFDSLREFFSLPIEKKMKVHQSLSSSFMGYEERYYTNVDRLKKGDLKESMTTGYEPGLDEEGAGYQPDILFRKTMWPDENDAPLFKPATRAYRASCLGLMRKLTQVMEKVIGVEDGFFKDKASYPVAGIRALYYPPQDPDDNESTGLGAHTDVQFMTMIAQNPFDADSLEVLNSEGRWIQPKLEKETFVVNLGDMMARLTNDVFQSTVHRVRNKSGKPRYSLPFFFGLNNDELVETLPKFITETTPLREGYEKGMTAYEHYNRRLQRARHRHPTATEHWEPGLPVGMTKINGVVVEGM